jgi:hypothetical protein
MNNSNFKITYHQEGDYLIPDLVIKKDRRHYQIGKYGYLRLDFLKNHKRGLYCELNLKNELDKHLIEVDKEANKRVNTIIDQLAKKENVSVYPDGKEPLSWAQKMNNIKNRAEEIVLNEIIYC